MWDLALQPGPHSGPTQVLSRHFRTDRGRGGGEEPENKPFPLKEVAFIST